MNKSLLSRIRRRFRSENLLGLDIGSRSIKLVQLRELSQGWQLVDVQVEHVPSEKGEKSQQSGMSGQELVLKDLVQRLGISGTEVAISISGPSVIVKPINVPWMTETELRGHLDLEIERYLPHQRDDVYWDFYFPRTNSQSALPAMTIYLVAAKRELVDERVALVAQAGLVPVIVDLDSFALANMYKVNYEDQGDASDLIVNLGPRGFNMIKVGMAEEFYLHDGTMSSEHSEDISQEEMFEDVTNEIQRAIEFCRTDETNRNISRVLLTGGYVRIPGLMERLSLQLEIPIEIVDPFKSFTISRDLLSRKVKEKTSALASVAVGLALRCGGGQ